ncbi:MAG: DUF3310 domain-containing protein [Peptostreptococcaceae bacterium]
MIPCKYEKYDRCNIELLNSEFDVRKENEYCCGESECGYYEEWLNDEIQKNSYNATTNINMESSVLPIIDKDKKEMVEHPNHYNSGKYEVIDVIDDWKLGFYEGNIIKYLARAKHKGKELEDLKKAKFYLDRLVYKFEGEE